MAPVFRSASTSPCSATTSGDVVAGSGGLGCLWRGRGWELCSATSQPCNWYSGGDIPDYRYGNVGWSGTLYDRHTHGYVIIVFVLFLGPKRVGKTFGGIGRYRWLLRTSKVSVRLILWTSLLVGGLAWTAPICAQDAPPGLPPDAPADLPGQVVLNPTGQCVQPPPMVQLQDYNGPLHKVIGTFTRKLDRLSVHDPHYKPGLVLCSLEIKDKFFLFLRDSVDPETFLAAGFDAGISQARNDDPTFGQEFGGYAKRFGASYTDEVQFRFFKEFAYPTIFSEDPRYYRMGQGPKGRRFLHAVRHSVVAYNDHGEPMFNFSEWLGEVSATSLSNLYHPGQKRGIGPAAENVAVGVGMDIGFDELREFWPEVARKLRLPFRDQNEPPPSALPAGR